MKVLTRHTFFSVLKVGIATALLASLMLMGVDLFSNLDKYTNYQLGFGKAVVLTLYYFPEAFLLALGPSFLFSVTYYLSMLHANNEIICILNSGVNFRRVVTPIIVLSILISAFYFGFNELVAIDWSNEKDIQTSQLTKGDEESRDNQNVALSDMQDGYMIYAAKYSDSNQTLYDVSYVEKAEDGGIGLRVDSNRAQYDTQSESWIFYDCYVYSPVESSSELDVKFYSAIDNTKLSLEPQLFRNVSSEISRMSLPLAKAYLMRMKGLNPDEYASLGTEYYKRVFSCLTPLVLMIIACSINYRFKKNILFFSIVSSICVAVVYYVIQMMTIMLADQGVIAPALGTLIPFGAIIFLSSIMSILLRG